MIDESIKQIAGAGLLGAVTAISLFVAYWKDRQLTIEKDARIADAHARAADSKEATVVLTRVQESNVALSTGSARIVAELEKMREQAHDRELREAERDRERDQRDIERERSRGESGPQRPWKGSP